MDVPSVYALDIRGKRVLVREDLNAPVQDGRVTSDARLLAALPTIELLKKQGAARILLASHLGRPARGDTPATAPQFSLAPVAARLGELLGEQVDLVDMESATVMQAGTIGLLENVRFQPGETDNDPALAEKLAGLCDVFVMDAFATAHRAHASTAGVIDVAEVACAGPLLLRELETLSELLEAPARPLVAVIGGAKISTKLGVLDRLAQLTDTLVVGGAIATTFLAAKGLNVGKSLIEASMLDEAERLLASSRMLLPVDVVVAREVRAGARTKTVPVEDIGEHDRVVDIGPNSRAQLRGAMNVVGTILWNGPLGVFEIDRFAAGTLHFARSVARSPAFSLAGGGDTLAAIDKAGVAKSISYISTGGGALLEFVEGRELPAIASLAARAR
ncbi:MAG: phosphoglycerate kinase [Gammaproteobacteria bacterium]|nr:phosphoglycerate kinase [Gammaproteobacteria bacterium]